MKFRLALLLPLLATLAGGCSHASHTVEVPKEDLQKKVSSKFPMSPEQGGSPVKVTLSDPELLLEEGKDKVGLRAKLVVVPAAKGAAQQPFPPPPGGPGGDAPKAQFTGHVVLYGSIAYEPDKKAIRISDPKVTELKIEQLPDELLKPVTQLVEESLNKKFAAEPIPLDDSTLKDKTVKTFLKSITVKNGKLTVVLGW